MNEVQWNPATSSERSALERHPTGWHALTRRIVHAGRLVGQDCFLLQPGDRESERRWVPVAQIENQ